MVNGRRIWTYGIHILSHVYHPQRIHDPIWTLVYAGTSTYTPWVSVSHSPSQWDHHLSSSEAPLRMNVEDRQLRFTILDLGASVSLLILFEDIKTRKAHVVLSSLDLKSSTFWLLRNANASLAHLKRKPIFRPISRSVTSHLHFVLFNAFVLFTSSVLFVQIH